MRVRSWECSINFYLKPWYCIGNQTPLKIWEKWSAFQLFVSKLWFLHVACAAALFLCVFGNIFTTSLWDQSCIHSSNSNPLKSGKFTPFVMPYNKNHRCVNLSSIPVTALHYPMSFITKKSDKNPKLPDRLNFRATVQTHFINFHVRESYNARLVAERLTRLQSSEVREKLRRSWVTKGKCSREVALNL